MFAFAVAILLARIYGIGWLRQLLERIFGIYRWPAGWRIPDYRARDEHRAAAFSVIPKHRDPHIRVIGQCHQYLE